MVKDPICLRVGFFSLLRFEWVIFYSFSGQIRAVLFHLQYLLSFPGCCWISSSRYFLAKSMNPFMGLLGLSGSFAFFFAGDIGGDIMEPPPVDDLTDEGSRFAIPCRSGNPLLLGPPGENWSTRSWLNMKQLLKQGITRGCNR